jgi:hypothetical protein
MLYIYKHPFINTILSLYVVSSTSTHNTILTVKFLIASSTCRILLNRKNSVVKDRNLYTTSGI